ncbi:MAG: hypothetical protein ABW004_08610 [Aeromicrobium sp.]
MAAEHGAGSARGSRGLTIAQVQRWVVSALIAAVTMFPLGALTAAIHVRADDDPGGAVILTVMMGAIGVAAAAAIRLVHQRSPWSPYLTLGTLAALSSTIWTWGL